MLLDDLEVFLDVCMMSCDSNKLKMAGEHIYRGYTLELAVWSRWAHFCVGIETSGARALVRPVTLRSKVAVGLSDTAAATSRTIG